MKINKMVLLYCGIFLTVIVCVIIMAKLVLNNKRDSGLKINNNNKLVVEVNGIDEKYILEEIIVIENISNEDKSYDLVWEDVTNNYINQSDLLYTVTGDSVGTRNIGDSQIPVVSFTMMENLTIKSGETHKYTVKVRYEKSEDSKDTEESNFKGNIIVNVK